MEKLCKIRDIQRTVNQFENIFEKRYGICLNESIVLCSLSRTDKFSSGELGELLGLSSSNISKIINSLEKKEQIKREMGIKDKRQMFFSITTKGAELLNKINSDDIEIPEVLIRMIE